MTLITEIHPPKAEIFGDYTPWPKRTPNSRRRIVWIATGASLAGVFAHCVLPMIAGI